MFSIMSCNNRITGFSRHIIFEFTRYGNIKYGELIDNAGNYDLSPAVNDCTGAIVLGSIK